MHLNPLHPSHFPFLFLLCTPRHLAASLGSFELVRTLLAMHVEMISAGAEALAGGRSQWGERYTGVYIVRIRVCTCVG